MAVEDLDLTPPSVILDEDTHRYLFENFSRLQEWVVGDAAWIAPTLLNGWVDFAGGFAAAGYRKTGRVVYIQGFIKSGTTTINTVLFTLPTGYRPADELVFTTLTSPNALMRLDVLANGDVVLKMTASATWLVLGPISFHID